MRGTHPSYHTIQRILSKTHAIPHGVARFGFPVIILIIA